MSVTRSAFGTVSAIACACVFIGCATGSSQRPLISDFDTDQKIDRQAQKYFKVIGGEKLKKLTTKKIGIFEFYVEFLEGDVEKSPEFCREYYSGVVRKMYDIVSGELKDAGFEILPLEAIADHEAYQGMELTMEAKEGGYSGARTTMVPRERLGLYPSTGWRILDTFKTFKEAKHFAEKEMQIVNDLNLDGIAHVNMFVSQGIDGSPIVSGYEIAMSIEYDRKQARSYFRSNAGLRLNKGKNLESRTSVKNSNGSVDVQKYDEALIELVEILSKMAGASLGYYLQ